MLFKSYEHFNLVTTDGPKCTDGRTHTCTFMLIRWLGFSNVYTLTENLSKIFLKIRRKIGDLIYDHGLTNYRFGANLVFIKIYFITRILLARLTPLHSENGE